MSLLPHSKRRELTRREEQVADCIRRGLQNKEIARELTLSEGTVKAHVAAVFVLLGAKNRAQAAVAADRRMSPCPTIG